MTLQILPLSHRDSITAQPQPESDSSQSSRQRRLLQSNTANAPPPASQPVVPAANIPGDPSGFTFQLPAVAPGAGTLRLVLNLRLYGSGLVPYSMNEQQAIRNALTEELTVLGNEFAIGQPNATYQDSGIGKSYLDTLLVTVSIDTLAQDFNQLLQQLQTSVRNAELAGRMRVDGLFNLQRLVVDSYYITPLGTLAPTPAPKSGAADAPAPGLGTSPAPAPNALQPQRQPQQSSSTAPVPGPEGSSSPSTVPLRAPAPSPQPAPAPSLPSGAPAPAPLQAPPLATPAPSPQSSQASAEAPVPAPMPNPQGLPAQNLTPPFPAPVLSPEGPVPAPAVLAPAPLDLVTAASVPAPAVAPAAAAGAVNFTLALQGSTSMDAASVQAALAALLGNLSASQVTVGGRSATSAGRKLLAALEARRRLLQSSQVLPVSIQAGSDEQRLAQQLADLASSGNLTSSLQALGLNVTGAQITSINGQPINSSTTAVAPTSLTPPASAPSTVPVAATSGWNRSAAIAATFAGVFGGLLLATGLICLVASQAARQRRKRFQPMADDDEASLKQGSAVSDSEAAPAAAAGRETGHTSGPETPMRSDNSATASSKGSDSGDEDKVLLLNSQDLSSYQGQYKFYVPTKDDTPATMQLGVKAGFGQALATPGLSSYAVMQLIASRRTFAGKYELESGCAKGDRAIIVAALETSSGRLCMAKFIILPADYQRELRLRQLLPSPGPLPDLVDSFSEEALASSGLPPCVIYDANDYDLTQWPTKLERPPDAAQKRAMLHAICLALADFHRACVVHGSLTPNNVVWHEASASVRLTSFSFWAFDGSPIPLHPALRYAPPEVVVASAAGKLSLAASYAMDAWCLGAIGYEMFARAPIFGEDYKDVDVIQSLLGKRPLPWEANVNAFDVIPNPAARNLIRNLLRRDPAQRWSLEQVLDSGFFAGLPKRNLVLGEPTAPARHPSYPNQAAMRVTPSPRGLPPPLPQPPATPELRERSQPISASPKPEAAVPPAGKAPVSGSAASRSVRSVLFDAAVIDNPTYSTESVGIMTSVPGDRRQAEDSLMGTRDSDNLWTMSVTASRALSTIGWEELEDIEEQQSDVLSEATRSGNFRLQAIPAAAMPKLHGSAVVVGITFEELGVSPSGGPDKLAEGVADGSIPTTEVRMVANRVASVEQPVFMLSIGAKFAVRVHLAAGSRRGWVPLMFQGAPKLRVGFSKSDQGDSLPVVATETEVSRWVGVAVWDSDSQRTRQMAGKYGQQTRLIVTSDWLCKGSERVVSVEHEIFAVFCAPGSKPAALDWRREGLPKGLEWAASSAVGATVVCRLAPLSTRQ